ATRAAPANATARAETPFVNEPRAGASEPVAKRQAGASLTAAQIAISPERTSTTPKSAISSSDARSITSAASMTARCTLGGRSERLSARSSESPPRKIEEGGADPPAGGATDARGGASLVGAAG